MNENAPTFTRPDGRPLPEMSHLAINSRRKFMFRATLDKGEKFVGKRITIQLRTDNPTIAKMKRDTLLEGYQAAGILCRNVAILEDEA